MGERVSEIPKEHNTTAFLDKSCGKDKTELKTESIASDIQINQNEVCVSKDNLSGGEKSISKNGKIGRVESVSKNNLNGGEKSSSAILGTRALQNLMKDKKTKSSDSILEGAGISNDHKAVGARSISSESSSSKSYLDTDVHSINHLTSNNSLESIQSETRSRGHSRHTLSSMGGKSEESSSKGSFDSASLKAQCSLDRFPHFDHLTAMPKPKTPKKKKGSRNKKLSVDTEPHPSPECKSKEIMQRSATLPSCSTLTENKKYMSNED